MSRKESRESKKREEGRLSDAELEQAQGGKRAARAETSEASAKNPEATEKNKACFRMLEEDFLFKRLERRGWRR